MKRILYKILKLLAAAIIKKYRPLVIGITGSVGKTSTKEAIYTLLKRQYKVRKNIKNYNNEIGVPLTIIGSETGNYNLWRWLKIFIKALSLIINKDVEYPEVLVLEMGADKVGDIGYLVDFVPCDIGIVTAISEVHLEFFGSLENITKEKQKIVSHLKNSHLAVLNADDPNVLNMRSVITAKILTFGFNQPADFQASDIKISMKNNQVGTSFKLKTQGKLLPVFLVNALGAMQVKAALAAITVASYLKINLLDAVEDLQAYQSPPGRTKLIKGIKKTLIIDDTYNSSPLAARAALDILNEVKITPPERKIAVFGEMLELGSYTEQAHQEVGQKAAAIKVDMLVAVGEKARDILRGAIKAGLSEDKTFYFADNHAAGLFVQDKLKEGDLILIKGSQNARMEQITKELMAEPLMAEQLLVRQGPGW
jgi:UDP-N-acetylmuramoyl-tripeptide--D-alanyl-D-alanine ligase